ncbi:MAG: exopolygalacturonase, partial [Bacteroidales bacterium]|nr:exopolygalacturonase [Bacteroidales bacterium]
MKRFVLAIFALMIIMPLGATEVWPDGTPIDKWFTSKPEKLPAKQLRRFMITDYGVVNDSTILQTEAIQKVIDMAAVDGGTVVVPKGVYLTSSLFFKSGTHLYLEKGAVLKGSDDVSDYPIRPVHIEGVIQPYIAAVINAYDVDGFSIKGDGVIDGNGLRYWRDFWTRRRVNPMCTNLEALRPRMLYVANGKNIHIEGVTLRNSGFWTTHLYKCDYV